MVESAQVTTRSPGRTPEAASQRAIRFACASSSQKSRRSGPATTASRRGTALAALANTSPTRRSTRRSVLELDDDLVELLVTDVDGGFHAALLGEQHVPVADLALEPL